MNIQHLIDILLDVQREYGDVRVMVEGVDGDISEADPFNHDLKYDIRGDAEKVLMI